MSTSSSSPSSSSPSTSSSTLTSTLTATTRKSSSSYPYYVLIMITFLSFSNVVLSQDNDSEMLLALKIDLENTGPLEATWKEGTDPCNEKKKWEGVVCKEGEIRVLRLGGFNLSGEFTADAIAGLKGLRTIDVSNNNFTGPLPDFYLIEGLSNIEAGGNMFTGDISPTFFARNPSRWRIIDFSYNQLTGKIPESLVNFAPNLRELYLEHNGFTGNVPEFKQQGLGKVNMSSNKFEGEIPEAMVTKFGADAFADNPGLCSDKIGKACPKTGDKKSVSDSGLMKWLILGVIIVILLGSLLIRKTKKPNSFTALPRDNVDKERLHVHKLKAMSRSRTSSLNRREVQAMRPHSPAGSSRKSSKGSKANAELIIVNQDIGSFGLPDLMKAAAEVLGNGALGSAYKALMGNGLHVVVKRLRELNKLMKDDFDREMRHLGGLRHKNILPLLAYHYRREEKLVINEYVPKGSLMYLLHGDKGTAHSELTWPIRLKIVKGVAQGMTFLHSEFSTHELPHGNLKSCNIVLSADYEPLLTDYAFHPLFSTPEAAQALFAYSSPEGTEYQEVSQKSDVYCLGIIILEILSGTFPSQYNKKGGTDIIQWARSVVSEKRETEMLDPEIGSEEMKSVIEMVKLLHIGVDCTTDEHDRRINMKEATARIGDIDV